MNKRKKMVQKSISSFLVVKTNAPKETTTEKPNGCTSENQSSVAKENIDTNVKNTGTKQGTLNHIDKNYVSGKNGTHFLEIDNNNSRAPIELENNLPRLTTKENLDIISLESCKDTKFPLKEIQLKPKIEKKKVNNKSTKQNVTNKIPDRMCRQPNEIQTVSQVVPVLIRDLPVRDLRQELDSWGIPQPSNVEKYKFEDCLGDIGLSRVKTFIQNVDNGVESTDMKTCFYCGFVTESSLVLARHLDVVHTNRFKRWPFTKRMDFKLFKHEEKQLHLFE